MSEKQEMIVITLGEKGSHSPPSYQETVREEKAQNKSRKAEAWLFLAASLLLCAGSIYAFFYLIPAYLQRKDHSFTFIFSFFPFF